MNVIYVNIQNEISHWMLCLGCCGLECYDQWSVLFAVPGRTPRQIN